MPRDPQALRDWYWEYNGLEDEQRATEILAQAIILDLEINAAPADLRASMFRGAFADRRRGRAVRRRQGHDAVDRGRPRRRGLVTLSIDMGTGLVVGSSVTRGPGGAVIPDAVPDHRVITTTSVVDSAP